MGKPVIRIDEELCDGCGLCISPCVEGVLALENGKAKVIRQDLCDGAGMCLGVCPQGALTLEQVDTIETIPEHLTADGLKCSFCKISEEDRYLIQVRKQGAQTWVCTRCLPGLIHG